MNDENLRTSVNVFLKLYFDSCKEVYNEINYEKITGKQFKYLKAIHKNENVTLTMLAEKFNTSKPTINEMLHKFHKSNIIEKTKCKTDKRVTYITLTEIGKLLATTNILESKKFVENLQSKLSTNELEALAQIFNKLEGEMV